MNINKLMKQAQAGGGMVTVRMNGHKQLLGVVIEKDVIDPTDAEMLQDLIVAAVNEGSRKVEEAMQEKMGGMAGGLGMPGLF
jgi:hypothetical protein